MVDVRVGEQHEIDAVRVEFESGVVFVARLAPALKHAAVHQKAHAGSFQHITGTRHLATGTMELDFHCIAPDLA